MKKARICGCDKPYSECRNWWAELQASGDEKVRVCDVCEQNVYRCDEPGDLEEFKSSGKRFAIYFYVKSAWVTPLRRKQ